MNTKQIIVSKIIHRLPCGHWPGRNHAVEINRLTGKHRCVDPLFDPLPEQGSDWERMKPLAIDIYCGLGGWTEGLLAEGFNVIGFDIEAHDYGDGKRYPAQLVIQDVLTIHGRQFKDAALIVASPPCQFFSYCAMPWSRAKKLAAEVRADPIRLEKELALFKACFRIQREAIEAAGHFIPMIVENVRGAQPWVGRARWNFGSFYLWGDVPALMPITQSRRMKSKISCAARRFDERVATTPEEAHALHYKLPDGVKAGDRNKAAAEGGHKWSTSFAENLDGLKLPGNEREVQRLCDAPIEGFKTQGMNWSDPATYGKNVTGHPGRKRGVSFTDIAGQQAGGVESDGVKVSGLGNGCFPPGGLAQGHIDGVKGFTPNGERLGQNVLGRKHGSESNARKAASATIAKIPFTLSRWIAKVYKPK